MYDWIDASLLSRLNTLRHIGEWKPLGQVWQEVQGMGCVAILRNDGAVVAIRGYNGWDFTLRRLKPFEIEEEA